MSTHTSHIVNRVHPTQGFLEAQARLAQNAVVDGVLDPQRETTPAHTEYHVPFPNHVGDTLVGVRTAEGERAPLVGKIEEVPPSTVTNPLPAQTATESVDAAAAELANVLPGLVQLSTFEQFAKFRLQCIAAFKHMGLDTRKFFS